MVRADTRPGPRSLLLGLPSDATARWKSGWNVFGEVGHVGIGVCQRPLHPPHATGRLFELHRRARRSIHRGLRSRKLILNEFHQIELLPRNHFRECLYRPFKSCCPNGLRQQNVTSWHRLLTQVIKHLNFTLFSSFSSSFVIPGMSIGTVVALPFSGFLAEALGWESVFYVQGGLAAIWLVLWIFFVYDSPQLHPRIHPKELELYQAATEAGAGKSRVSQSTVGI